MLVDSALLTPLSSDAEGDSSIDITVLLDVTVGKTTKSEVEATETLDDVTVADRLTATTKTPEVMIIMSESVGFAMTSVLLTATSLVKSSTCAKKNELF